MNYISRSCKCESWFYAMRPPCKEGKELRLRVWKKSDAFFLRCLLIKIVSGSCMQIYNCLKYTSSDSVISVYVTSQTHHTESELRELIGSIFSSIYTSVVKETSVSCADWKFVTLRAGIPRHLKTETENVEWVKETVWVNMCRNPDQDTCRMTLWLNSAKQPNKTTKKSWFWPISRNLCIFHKALWKCFYLFMNLPSYR